MTRPKGDGTTTCKSCGSIDLWANFFDAEGLGTDTDANGATWDVLCESCGRFQNRPAPRKRSVRNP